MTLNIRSDEGLTLETSAFEHLTVANLHFNLVDMTKLPSSTMSDLITQLKPTGTLLKKIHQ